MSDDRTHRCYCPVCHRSFDWGDGEQFYNHLRREHQLDDQKANAIGESEFRRIQHSKLRTNRNRMWNWTLDTFPASDPAGERALTLARSWLSGDDEPWRPRLYIDGPPGTGKTGLAWSLAREWIDLSETTDWSGEIEFENVRALLETQRERFSRGESKAIDHLLGGSRLADRLTVLDDLGAERPTEFALETIALIVEHLHAIDAPLIVTTNYTPRELANRLGHDDLVVGQRIVSRLIEGALHIRLDRADLRIARPDPAPGPDYDGPGLRLIEGNS